MTKLFARLAAISACLALVACATGYENRAPIVAPAVADMVAVVLRSPTCACCHEHQTYLRGQGMNVTSLVREDLDRLKDMRGIPPEMRSCHTTDIGNYFVEGHVPVDAIAKLMAEQPAIDGIALPGMPAGSPGMSGEKTDPFVVYAIAEGAVVGEFGTF